MARCICAVAGGALAGVILLAAVAFIMSEKFDVQLISI